MSSVKTNQSWQILELYLCKPDLEACRGQIHHLGHLLEKMSNEAMRHWGQLPDQMKKLTMPIPHLKPEYIFPPPPPAP